MEFKYKDDPSQGGAVAALYNMSDADGVCLNVNLNSTTHSLWCYEDGSMDTQAGAFKLKDNPVKVFYKGDEITIKF